MDSTSAGTGWRSALPAGLRPYIETAPLAALFLGVSSGFPFAMIAATLTTRLAQEGIDKKSVTAFALTFLAYNLKWAWAPLIDKVTLPLIGRIGQRRSWLLVTGLLVMASVIVLGNLDPTRDLAAVAAAAIMVGMAGATFDIVIDAYRIEMLEPEQLGVGSGMSQYGWRIGAAATGAIALVVAARWGWGAAYSVCALFALPAIITGLVLGEPKRKVVRTWPDRMDRMPYAIFALSFAPVYFLALWLDDILDVTILSRMVLVGYVFPLFDLTARRARDAGWSPQLAWLMVFPVTGFLYAMAYGWESAMPFGGLAVGAAVALTVAFAPQSSTSSPAGGVVTQRIADAVGPLTEFFRRKGGWLILLFVLVHKIGDTLANLTLRLLFEDLGFTNDEIAFYDVSIGFVTLLAGIFVGGIIYARLGLKKSVMISLILMAVSNLSFAGLAMAGHSNAVMAAAVGFENFASGIGGVCVVAYISALCNLSFTATQFAMLSAAASIIGRLISGTSAGRMIEAMGYIEFYLITTVLALPGVILFWLMMRSGLVDSSIAAASQKTEPT